VDLAVFRSEVKAIVEYLRKPSAAENKAQ